MLAYSERRALLEELELETERVRLVATFEDGEPVFAAVCACGLADSRRVTPAHLAAGETGVFAARMQVELVNDGPVTIVLDT